MSTVLSIGCPACGATHRVVRDKVARGLAATCVRCHAALPSAVPVEVDRLVGFQPKAAIAESLDQALAAR
jgi:hypothetical protein